MNTYSSFLTEVRQASFLTLEHERADRDRGEAALLALRASPLAKPTDRLNIDLALAGAEQRRGAHMEALKRLQHLNVAARSAAGRAKLQLRATSFYQLGRFKRAAEMFDALLADTDAHRDTASMAFLRIEAGRAFKAAGRVGDAIDQTQSAISTLEQLGNEEEHLIRARSNLAAFMLGSSDADQRAQGEADLEVLTDRKIASGDLEGMANNFSTLSLYFVATGRIEKAIAYGRKDLMLARKLGDDRGLAASLGNMAGIYMTARQLTQARAHNEEMRAIGVAQHNVDLQRRAAKFAEQIDATGRWLSEQGIGFGLKGPCVCESGEVFQKCCGRADHEPVALRTPIGGVSEDVDALKDSLLARGITPENLDFAMHSSEEARERVSWTETRAQDGWFEMFELPDMANIHLNAAASLAEMASNNADSPDGPLACAMLSVSALEAFINSTIYFASEAARARPIALPVELISDPALYQRQTNLIQKWDVVSKALCSPTWPDEKKLWSDFTTLVDIRNELVHFKAEGFERVAPVPKQLPPKLRAVPSEVRLRPGILSWPMKLLTPSFATWSVEVSRKMMHVFREGYVAARDRSLANVVTLQD